MATVSGQGTTHNLPNYVGELYNISPGDTPFLSSIGGLAPGGGEVATSTIFGWQEEDLRDASKTRQRLEGANAPTAEARSRANVTNVVEIHQEAIETSYTKMAATGQFASTGSNHPNAVGILGNNPSMSEHDRQVSLALRAMARDIERGFVNGQFVEPADNATARQTRGLLPAITANVSDQGTLVGNGASTIATNGTITEASHGLSVNDPVVFRSLAGGAIGVVEEEWTYYVRTAPDGNTFTVAATVGGTTITFAATGTADLYEPIPATKTMILDLMQSVYDSGGINVADTATLMVGPAHKRSVTKLFITDSNYQEQSRMIGGVKVSTIMTDFGDLNVMLNRHMPSSALAVVSLEQCAPVFLLTPGKGFLFEEPLAKVGAADRSQIYGEVGLKYGNQRAHGKVVGVTMATGA